MLSVQGQERAVGEGPEDHLPGRGKGEPRPQGGKTLVRTEESEQGGGSGVWALSLPGGLAEALRSGSGAPVFYVGSHQNLLGGFFREVKGPDLCFENIMWLHVEKILESRGGHQETSLDFAAGGQTGDLGPRGSSRDGEVEEGRREAGVTNQGGLPGWGLWQLAASCPNWKDGGTGLGKGVKSVPMGGPRF